MYRIAIIDDNEYDLKQAREMVERAMQNHNLPCRIETFPGYRAYGFACEEQIRHDLYVIDVQMPDGDGFQLARELRREDAYVPILFLTGYGEYAPEGYEVQACAYFLKPGNREEREQLEEKLEKKLRLLYQEWERLGEYYYVTSGLDCRRIPYRDILYFRTDSQKRKTEIVTHKGRYHDRRPLKEIQALLDQEPFVLAERGYLIHLHYILAFDGDVIEMSNGDRIPVSRRNLSMVRKKMMDYMKGRKHVGGISGL